MANDCRCCHRCKSQSSRFQWKYMRYVHLCKTICMSLHGICMSTAYEWKYIPITELGNIFFPHSDISQRHMHMMSSISQRYILQIQKQHNDFMIAKNICFGVNWDVHSTHSSEIAAELTEKGKQIYHHRHPLQIQKLKLFLCTMRACEHGFDKHMQLCSLVYTFTFCASVANQNDIQLT